MNSRDKRVLRMLRCVAEDISQPAIRNIRIVSAVVKGGKVFGMGMCSRKTSTIQSHFSKNEFAIYEHAEIAAIKNAIKRHGTAKLGGSTLYVVRRKLVGGEYVDALAKPCDGCQRAIDHFGITNVVYTND